MKKRIVGTIAIAVVLATMIGCTASGVQSPTGFSTVIGPAFFTSCRFPSLAQPASLEGRKYKVLSNVTGTASTKSIFFFVGVGDGGINDALEDAMRNCSGADDIIDLKVDTDVTNVMWLFIKSTTIVKGKAIKYLDEGVVDNTK